MMVLLRTTKGNIWGLIYLDEMTEEDVENNESYEAGCSWSLIPSARYPSFNNLFTLQGQLLVHIKIWVCLISLQFLCITGVLKQLEDRKKSWISMASKEIQTRIQVTIWIGILKPILVQRKIKEEAEINAFYFPFFREVSCDEHVLPVGVSC